MLELLLLFAFCIVLAMGCLAAGVAILVTSEAVGVEQIYLLTVCVLLGVTFLGFAAWMARFTPLHELWKAKPAPTSPSAQGTSGNVPKEEAARQETSKSVS